MVKNVLITGASHGIGAATALAFAQAGYNVGINYFKDKDGADATAVKVRDAGMKAETYRADVSSCAESEAMMENIDPRLLNGFFHDAGVHCWVSPNNVVYANNSMVAISASSQGNTTLKLPQKEELTDIFTGERITTEKKESVYLNMKRHETRIFLRNKIEDIEHK